MLNHVLMLRYALKGDIRGLVLQNIRIAHGLMSSTDTSTEINLLSNLNSSFGTSSTAGWPAPILDG